MNLITALARLLIFPGLLFAIPAAWFFLWVERKSVAMMQGRIGPPFMQPFFDFIKLLGKTTPSRPGIAGLLMRLWPLLAVSAAAGAVGLLPVLPSSGGFEGDLILLLALLELPSMCIIAAGFSSRSIFGEIGSAREAVLSVSYNVVFLPARQAALESLLSAQRRAGDLLRPHDRIRRARAGDVGSVARSRVGRGHRPGRNARRSAPDRLVACRAGLCCYLLWRGPAALSGCRRHSAVTDRYNGPFLLAMHTNFRGSGYLVRALYEVQIMNILSMLWKNLWGGSRTLLFPARPKVSQGFRGLVRFDPALCTGCAICRFRCTARAIEYKAGKGEFYWSYDPGHCTFCGRCVEGCKAHALTQDAECPPLYLTIGELKNSYTVARKAPAPKPAPVAKPAVSEPAASPVPTGGSK
ncbi:MAG: NADH-quinone oxidoreductase subunit H [Terracidiphilus sp.]